MVRQVTHTIKFCATIIAMDEVSLTLKMHKDDACAMCAASQACTTRLLAKAQVIVLPKPATLVCAVGDSLSIDLSERLLRRAMRCLYAWPLLLVLFGALYCSFYDFGDGRTCLVIGGLLLVGYWIARCKTADSLSSSDYYKIYSQCNG